MAILLGTRGDDILSWRGVVELVAEQRALIAEMMSGGLIDESLGFLKAFNTRLDEEIAFEARFAKEFGSLLTRLDRAVSDEEVFPLLPRFTQLVQDYFVARGSVVAVHAFCNAYQDRLLRWVIQRLEAMIEREEVQRPPAPYCWLVCGSEGRMEHSFCIDPSWFLIHGETDSSGRGYFEKFANCAVALLGRIGMLPDNDGGALMKSVWSGGRNEWREEITGRLLPGESVGYGALLGYADIRLVYGDEGLAAEMMNVVRSLLTFGPGQLRAPSAASFSRTRAAILSPAPALREVGKSITDISTGLDFFGRLRVEKSGRYRGRFNLEQYALNPLVTNIRMLAIEFGLSETGTIDRIKKLQLSGRLSVELAERLLHAYHDFSRLKLLNQIRTACEAEAVCHIDPRELSEDDDQRLRAGLESVSDLEKIAYLIFTEQG